MAEVCAAQGLLPGQGNNDVLFATAPYSLDPKEGSERPLGRCAGWRPDKAPTGGFGYTNDDIYYIEVCLWDQICTNGAEVFEHRHGAFQCDFSEERFRELQAILAEPAVVAEDPPECVHASQG